MSTLEDDEEKLHRLSAKFILAFWILMLVFSVLMLVGMGWCVVWMIKFLVNLLVI